MLLFLVHPLLGAIGLISAVALLALALLTGVGDAATDRASRSRAVEELRAACDGPSIYSGDPRQRGMRDGAAQIVYRDAEAARRAQDTAMHRTEIILGFSKSMR